VKHGETMLNPCWTPNPISHREAMAEPLLLGRKFPPPGAQKAAVLAHDRGGGGELAHPPA